MTQSTLFPQPVVQTLLPDAPQAGPFAAVALEQSVDKLLDYTIPPKLVASLAIGQRVRMPLGAIIGRRSGMSSTSAP